MKRNVVHKYTRTIDFNLVVDIQFLDIRIITGSGLEILGNYCDADSIDKAHLAIIIQSQLDSFESLSDGVAYSRPRLLIAFGMLSYFTQQIFTPFETYQSSSYVGDFELKATDKFII